ncbi:MAG: response regulator [Undibacterium sp.]|nr:response regulator [Opitutaceae bacterium]
MKLLIVDDEPVARHVLRQILSAQPEHQLTLAEGGAEAWALLDDPSRYFDIVFLDVSMPEPGGLEIARRLRESPLHRSVRIVLCTASQDRETVTKAVQLGVRHYIVKPCSAPVVMAKMQQIKATMATF